MDCRCSISPCRFLKEIEPNFNHYPFPFLQNKLCKCIFIFVLVPRINIFPIYFNKKLYTSTWVLDCTLDQNTLSVLSQINLLKYIIESSMNGASLHNIYDMTWQ